MWEWLGNLVAALTVAWAARGGLRRRDLADAAHELEVAAKLDPRSELRAQLERRAHTRVARYVRRPDAERRVRLAYRFTLSLTSAAALVASTDLAGINAWTAGLGIGGLVGVLLALTEDRVVAHVARGQGWQASTEDD